MKTIKKPKISVIGTRGLPNVPGGAEIHIQNLYAELSSHSITTVYARKPYFPRFFRLKKWSGIRIKYIWCPKNKFLETLISSLLSVIDCLIHKPDIAHFHNIGSGFFMPLLKLREVRIVLTYHSMNFEHEKWGTIGRKFLGLCEFISVKCADEVIAVSPLIAERIENRFKRRSYVIPNGVHQLPIKKTTAIIEQYQCQKEKYILYVGRIEPEKCVHVLIEAFISLKMSCPKEFFQQWKLVVIGNLDFNNRYTRRVYNLATAHNEILFTGSLSGDALQEFYSQAAVFVLPSKNEGYPIALLEAMSYKLPCIVSDIPELRHFNFQKDYYFEAKNAKILGEKLRKIITLKKVIRPNYPLNDNKWNRIAKQTYDVMSKMAGRKQ